MAHLSEASRRAGEYCKRKHLSIEKQIGSGTQGVVFATKSGTAVKALERLECYERERDVYLRLVEKKIETICGFNVPALVNFHDELLVVEMQLVTRPYVLDFASAYLDAKPPYYDDEEIMATDEAFRRDLFEEKWPKVQEIVSAFRQLGIHLADVKPKNIEFAQ